MSTLVYTSSTESGGLLFGDCSLYAYLDSIQRATITNYTSGGGYSDGYENCVINIGPIRAAGVEGDVNFGTAKIGPISIYASEPDRTTGDINIGPVWSKGTEGSPNFGAVRIGPIDVEGDENEIVIDYSVGNINIGPLSVFSYEAVRDECYGSIEIGPVGAVGSEGQVVFGHAPIGPISAFGYTIPKNYLSAYWDDFTVGGTYASFGPASMYWPARTLYAEGEPTNGTIALTWPARALTAHSGGTAELTWPTRILTVTGTLQSIGTAELVWAERTLSAEGLSGDLGAAALLWPNRALTAHGGGHAELSWPTRTLTVTGLLDIVGTASLTWPARTLTADGLLGGVGTATLTWPVRTLTATGLTGGLGTISLAWPTRVLVATGSGATTETTYAVNLSTGAVTQLLLGAFDKLVTAHGKLYGLRNGTLVYLGGDTDQGTEIPVTIRFAPQQFGTNLAKRIDGKVYLNTREDDGVTLTVIEDETTAWPYQSDTDTAPAMGTCPVRVGRGITFHSLGLIVQNRDGGRLDIGGLEIPVIPLSRRPK